VMDTPNLAKKGSPTVFPATKPIKKGGLPLKKATPKLP